MHATATYFHTNNIHVTLYKASNHANDYNKIMDGVRRKHTQLKAVDIVLQLIVPADGSVGLQVLT